MEIIRCLASKNGQFVEFLKYPTGVCCFEALYPVGVFFKAFLRDSCVAILCRLILARHTDLRPRLCSRPWIRACEHTPRCLAMALRHTPNVCFFVCSPFWTCPIQFFRIGTIEGQSLGDAGWKNRAAFKDERVSKTKQNVVLKRVSMMAWGLVFRKSEVFGFDGAEGLPSGSGEVENGVSEFGEWDEGVGVAAF